MHSSRDFLRSGRVGVLVIALGALGVAGCRDDDPEAPVPTPSETAVVDTVAEAVGSSVTPTSLAPEAADPDNEPTGTELITIDGPATVDSSFSGANPGGG